MADQPITARDFVDKWKGRTLTERGGSQTHFIELCRMLGVPYPGENRADDPDYCFDALTAAAGSHRYNAPAAGGRKRKKPPAAPGGAPQPQPGGVAEGASPSASASRIVSAPQEGHGFADVWKRGHFCWEYKRQGKRANLADALRQLKEYKDSLDNPPLLIVCDVDNFEIHTNFTGYPTTKHTFRLEDLADTPKDWRDQGISPLTALRYAFTNPDWFKPAKSSSAITEELAGNIGDLAVRIGERKGNDPHDVAHFLMQIVFALFAEDTKLLPADVVTQAIETNTNNPERFKKHIRELFRTMEKGGEFGVETIPWFNGGLFRDVDKQPIPDLTRDEIGNLSIVARADWSAVEPSILGTLFERSLDPDKRAQIGAHYTSRDDIMLIVEPVILEPLRGEWTAIKARAEAAPANGEKKAAHKTIQQFHDRLASIRILDPACGSGNFLYVAVQSLLDLEKQVIVFARTIGLNLEPAVAPTQLRGIELNEYAAELARISIWIGYLKWQQENGLTDTGKRPILDNLESIQCRDAILKTDKAGGALPHRADWPEAHFIVGNPPFLGSKLFRRQGVADAYLKALFAAYDLPKTSDLCCYWFELGRQAIEIHQGTRAGLLATQGIRGGDNRKVLERIKESGDIFMAWSDREWTLDGAAVQVSMIGFDDGTQTERTLDDTPVQQINADLTADADASSALTLPENAGIAYMGDTKGGAFDIEFLKAAELLAAPNPHRQPSSDVVRPWVNGLDITRRPRGMWIVDYGCEMEKVDAARYEAPFAYVEAKVFPERKNNRRETYAKYWWIHVEPRPSMREDVLTLNRFLVTPTLTKHRLFSWLEGAVLPDHQLIVFARAGDYFFGVLHSSVHESWARRVGTQLREAESGFRYTPSTCFETFPMPWPPGQEPATPKARHHALWKAIGDAAAELDRLRENWLNPAPWVAAVEKSVDINYRSELAAVPKTVRPLVRRSAVMAEATQDNRLKARTLTNLYNERPEWLRQAHDRLDRAVLAAYAAVDTAGGWDPDWASVYVPFGAGEIEIKDKREGRAKIDKPEVIAAKQAAIVARQPVDEKILANLLRLNHARAGSKK